jgi:hypothetical protein
MRLSFLPVLVAGAGMIASQVTAEPIVDTSGTNANLRFGHVLANANVNGNDDSAVARPRPVLLMATITSEGSAHRGCKGSFRGKLIQLSNAFRHALGLPLIEMGEYLPVDPAIIGKPHPHPHVGGEAHILPLPLPPFEGAPESFVHGHHAPSQMEDIGDQPTEPPVEHPHHKGHQHKHKKFRKHGCRKRVKGFFRRIHKAITALGPWEGRAVSFVLGCGIGVLLRMFWVLSVLAYRTIRGEREESQVREYVVLDQDVETIFIAPPQYSDEKQVVIEDQKPQVNA